MRLVGRTSSLFEANRLSHIFGDTKQLDRDLARSFSTRIAREPLCPREARVGTLRTGKDDFRVAWRSSDGRHQAHLDALVPHELETGTPMLSPAPIPPEKRLIPNPERMQEHAHLAWFLGDTALPLALLAQRTRATTANAGRIHHAQAPVNFSTPFMGDQCAPGWTPEGPVRLERKV